MADEDRNQQPEVQAADNARSNHDQAHGRLHRDPQVELLLDDRPEIEDIDTE